ncbi:D-alanyl-D-alanine carboxypeptidase/D-alanyl-D-alanine-endopeptidase [Dyadobacter sp. CY312]|uniref:D-alanyl-D-alanine carboxypeptidase/D-alanyl-D-alanine endopeptidase n=1 Tax=Dyadobacter sp. CY312 TaxID=2907303 RepID=UPI001F1A014E|nr:D-alanyl-D-alanine carboxypeptidase/D-alanyl-D-alanine-endopeptidase [Dyadobacter sp. CY312]MCE7039891.1 D-alanyl-D-alanine carboxypeptidase/D-alanyl-D-alanine-endopeptidase [Dyadobacter sp. CY312]
MKFILTILFSLWGCASFAQSPDSLSISNLSDAVLELQNSELFRNGTLAVSLTTVKDGKNVFSVNPELSLPSASTLKLISTATVLSIFGSDYRFRTFLEHDGVVRKDTLYGNVYIRGTGDPSLGSDRFKGYPNYTTLLTRWAQAVSKAGIKVIKGKILADASFFDKKPVADSWIYADLGNYYGAGVYGLNFNENQYKVKFKPGVEVGDPVTYLGTEPALPYLAFQNQVLTGEKGSGDKTILYGNPLSSNVVMTGTIPLGFTTYSVKGSIPDPGFFLNQALKEAMSSTQIVLIEPVPLLTGDVVASVGERKVLDEYKSPPLQELCLQTNLWSINLYADSFLKQIGKRLSGNSEFDASVTALANYWSLKNADVRGFFIKDGSGLSPSGSLTVHNLTTILNTAGKGSDFDSFYKTIAVMGQSGTVRNLGKGTIAAGNIRAKSGSIEGTRAFAGYVTSKSGALMSFAIIANKYQPGSQRIVSDELVRLMTLMAEI